MKNQTITASYWLAADWGTSHLRVWVIDAAGKVIERLKADCGMAHISPDQFESEFVALVRPFLSDNVPTKVICCGMAGSQQGWREALYLQVPCKPPSVEHATLIQTADPRIQVHILPGVKQMSPVDVMRGEETQIKGFLALNKDFDGVICLPGTHTKWVHVSAGEMVSFQTFMTGEIFSLISKQSILKHNIDHDSWDRDVFLSSLADAMSKPAAFSAALFSMRAQSLVSKDADHFDQNLSRLSGLLIGMELVAARPYWLGQAIAVLGDAKIAKAYTEALQGQGVPVLLADAERMTLEGLKSAYKSLDKEVAR
jgi:2-dehydro-3-deoxygalactonokinase